MRPGNRILKYDEKKLAKNRENLFCFPDNLIFRANRSSCMKTGFGFIEIDGITYDHDVIIHTDGSVSKRKKNKSKALKEDYGHTPLSEYELDILVKEKPVVVYIGTGQYGTLPMTEKASGILKTYSAVIAPTPDIIVALAGEDRRYLAILHVTC